MCATVLIARIANPPPFTAGSITFLLCNFLQFFLKKVSKQHSTACVDQVSALNSKKYIYIDFKTFRIFSHAPYILQ